jgi:hypothetical protein
VSEPRAGDTTTCVEPGCAVRFGLNPETGRCFNHDPERREAAQAARSKGGATTGARASKSRTITSDELASWGPLEGLEDVARWLGRVTATTATGGFDARTGDVLCYALGTMGRTLEKVAEMDRRLKAAQGEIERLRAKIEEQERP